VQCLQRIAFRLFAVYLVMYCAPALLLGTLPGPSPLADAYEKPWLALVPWAGKHLLGRDVIALYSGDTTYGYVELFCYLLGCSFPSRPWSEC